MGEVVALPLPRTTPNEAERQRFERWASSMLRRDEAEKLLARDRKGQYVNRVAHGAWCAWQVRGIMDADREGLQTKPADTPPYD